jgi:hypothetical protein
MHTAHSLLPFTSDIGHIAHLCLLGGKMDGGGGNDPCGGKISSGMNELCSYSPVNF